MPVPEGFVLMAPNRLGPILTTPILSWRGKLRMLHGPGPARARTTTATRAWPRSSSAGSAARRSSGWCSRWSAGIYTADPDELSLKATLPQFPAMEREHGSLILRRAAPGAAGALGRAERLGRAGTACSSTLADGMDTLPRALAAALPPGRSGPAPRSAGSSRPDPVSPWLVELLDGPPIEAGAVVLATEAHASARLLDGFDPDLALQLRAIPYASSVDRQRRLPPRPGRAPARRLRRGRAGHRGPVDPGRLVPERQVPRPGARRARSCSASSSAGATQPDLFERDDEAINAHRPRRAGRPARGRGRAAPDRGRPAPARDAPVHARPPRPGRGDPAPGRPASPADPDGQRLRRRRHPRLHPRRPRPPPTRPSPPWPTPPRRPRRERHRLHGSRRSRQSERERGLPGDLRAARLPPVPARPDPRRRARPAAGRPPTTRPRSGSCSPGTSS